MNKGLQWVVFFNVALLAASFAYGQALPNIDISGSPDGVVMIPQDAPEVIKEAVFCDGFQPGKRLCRGSVLPPVNDRFKPRFLGYILSYMYVPTAPA